MTRRSSEWDHSGQTKLLIAQQAAYNLWQARQAGIPKVLPVKHAA